MALRNKPPKRRVGPEHRSPKGKNTNNGSEFPGLVYDKWACARGSTTDYSRRGTPTDNDIIERCKGSLRDECLNVNWFMSTEDACEKIELWRHGYNRFRPHSSLMERISPCFFRMLFDNWTQHKLRNLILSKMAKGIWDISVC